MPLGRQQIQSLLSCAPGALALAVVLGFLIAYASESGFAMYFNIPRSFIPSAFNQLIATLLSLLGRVTLLLLFPSTFLSYKWHLKKNKWLLKPTCFLIICLGLYPLTYGGIKEIGFQGLLWELVFVAFGAFFVILSLDIEFRSLHITVPKIIAIFIFILPVAYCLGRIDAKTNIPYMTPISNNGTPNGSVVLRIYGDKFICAQFDGKLRKVSKTFTIINVTGDSVQQFKLSPLGPLTPESEDHYLDLKNVAIFALIFVLGFFVRSPSPSWCLNIAISKLFRYDIFKNHRLRKSLTNP